MTDLTIVMFAVFLAASLPFVISILISLSSGQSSQTAADYFLANRELTVGGFIASSIGYSLQVSSIFLFFYWGILYGIYPLIMCVTWAAGYILLGFLLRRGKLDRFLNVKEGEFSASNTSGVNHTTTIHGYVGTRTASTSEASHNTFIKTLPTRLAILVISLASVIGIAGTMMTEIDYSSAFFLQALGLETSNSVVRIYTQLSILLFTTLYVLWGGFKAAVITDRFQVPVAYVGLGVLTILLTIYAQSNGSGIVVYLLAILVIIYLLLLIVRLSALRSSNDPWSRVTAYLTFGTLFAITLATICVQPWPTFAASRGALLGLLHPGFPSQFVFWGGISLLVTNLLWQFIDITSLQRLQAINKNDIQKSRSQVASVIEKIGIESALGWTFIIVCALVLKLIGITEPGELIPNLLGAPNSVPLLVPLFIVTVVVFMLSTISGFISAVAYIAHFDIAPALGLYDASSTRTGDEIRITRLVTLVCVLLIYGGYTLLRATIHGDISTVLYAIWSFQLAIAPAVLVAMFTMVTFSPWIVIASTLSGLATAWYVPTHPMPSLLWIPIAADSWSMIPPVAVVLVSCSVFALLVACSNRFKAK